MMEKYRVNEAVSGSKVNGEMILLNLASGSYINLDEIGSRIWELLHESKTLNELVLTLIEEYDVDADRCQEDVCVFLVDLLEKGVVQVAE